MSHTSEITVKVAADGASASLVAPSHLDAATINPKTLEVLVAQTGIKLDPDVIKNLEAFVVAYGAGDVPIDFVIARATPPIAGTAGRIEWAPGYDPAAAHTGGVGGQRTDHYAGFRYIKVKNGDTIAKMIPATDGVEGRDVHGRVIKAIPGKSASVRFHSSVSTDSQGRVIAQADGVLVVQAGLISVSNHLDINGFVDFSTGHVDFAGLVSISGGIRAGFKVIAGNDLNIGGLVEPSEVRCGQNLVSRGGIAGNHKGTLHVGGNAKINYIEKLNATIGGNLDIDHEIADCKLTVGGNLVCREGTILGGETAVTGSLIVRSLGSEAYVPTTIILGEVPIMQEALHETARELLALKDRLAALGEKERQLKLSPRPSAKDRESLTELAYELDAVHHDLKAKATKLTELDAAIKAQKKLDVEISRVIHPKVKFIIGEYTVLFKEVAKGPMWIGWDQNRQLVFRIGQGTARPLSEIAHIARAADPKAAQAPPRNAAAA